MTDDQAQQRAHARAALTLCALYIRKRDEMIRRADALGITQREIAQTIGLSRQHVSAIVTGKGKGGPQRTSEAEGTAQQPKDDR